jgi:uroporphyrinogen decarboxylase
VTLQPLRRYDLDAAILFSDILTVPDALGLGLYFETGEGPKFKKPRTEQDVLNFNFNAKSDLDYVMNAVSTIRSALGGQVPLIGFSGSPWTLATYMIEGGSSKDFRHTKHMLYAQPEVLHALLDRLAVAVIDYLNAQSMQVLKRFKFLIVGAARWHTVNILNFHSTICKKLSRVYNVKKTVVVFQ